MLVRVAGILELRIPEKEEVSVISARSFAVNDIRKS